MSSRKIQSFGGAASALFVLIVCFCTSCISLQPFLPAEATGVWHCALGLHSSYFSTLSGYYPEGPFNITLHIFLRLFVKPAAKSGSTAPQRSNLDAAGQLTLRGIMVSDGVPPVQAFSGQNGTVVDKIAVDPRLRIDLHRLGYRTIRREGTLGEAHLPSLGQGGASRKSHDHLVWVPVEGLWGSSGWERKGRRARGASWTIPGKVMVPMTPIAIAALPSEIHATLGMEQLAAAAAQLPLHFQQLKAGAVLTSLE